MKTYLTHSIRILAVVFFAIMTMTSCIEDECDATTSFQRWDPVIVSASDFRVAPAFDNSHDLRNPGKLYYYNDILLINEIEEGVHLYDNSDPANPVVLGFIEIPGNIDIAIKNGFLYADNYTDLLVIDISSPTDPRLVQRNEEVFPLFGKTSDDQYIVDYVMSEERVEIPCDDPMAAQPWFWNGNVFFEDNTVTNVGGPTATPKGIAGSMASFSVVGDYLYVVDENSLKVFDVEQPDQVSFLHTNYFSWGIETIFPYGDNLFIGTQNGMHIFDNSNPSEPVWMAAFAHATACDPVFVDGDIAYVTLRDGRECETFTNQLDVVDISDLYQPELMTSYQMEHPHGLSVRSDILYLCEGQFGLKVFGVEDPYAIDQNLLEHLRGFDAYDVISLADDHLLMVGADGLYQFDTKDPQKIETLSKINVVQ